MNNKTIEEKLISALKRRKTTINAESLAQRIGHPVPSVRRTLVQMLRAGKVYRDVTPPHVYWLSRAA